MAAAINGSSTDVHHFIVVLLQCAFKLTVAENIY